MDNDKTYLQDLFSIWIQRSLHQFDSKNTMTPAWLSI